jgi:hypothetical protein
MTTSKDEKTVTLKRNYDEKFIYEILPPIGDGVIKEEGDTKSLLEQIPYLLSFGIIPAEKIMNEILASGLEDAGMSGGVEWEPYGLNEGEFDKLVSVMEDESNGALKYVVPPEWVENYSDWRLWSIFYEHEIPVGELKRLKDQDERIEQERVEAESRGDKELAEKLHLQSLEAGKKLAQYIMKHEKKKKKHFPL